MNQVKRSAIISTLASVGSMAMGLKAGSVMAGITDNPMVVGGTVVGVTVCSNTILTTTISSIEYHNGRMDALEDVGRMLKKV